MDVYVTIGSPEHTVLVKLIFDSWSIRARRKVLI